MTSLEQAAVADGAVGSVRYDWCPLSGARLQARVAIPLRYRMPCGNRLRRRSLLAFLRLSEQPDRESCRRFSSPTCQPSRIS